MNIFKCAKTLKRRSVRCAAAVAAALCALTAIGALFARSASPAFANSAAPYEERITSAGIHVVSENSVLQVVGEKLTFKLGTPLNELKDDEKYDTTVTAEYTFYNPTDDTVNTKMAFPITMREDYGYKYYDNAINPITNPITVNGETVQHEVRHTYGTYNSFAEDVAKIKDDYITTDFFSPDLPVTEYVFRANIGDNGGSATFRAKMPQSATTRFFCNKADNGDYFEYGLSDGYKFSIYVLGEDNGELENLNWTASRYNYNFDRNVPVDGSVTFVRKSEPTTFKDYVLKTWDSKGEVSEMDWYNAIFDIINKDGIWAGSGDTPYNVFTEWYVYETTVAPKSSFTNAVTAYMYPRTYYRYTPYLYEFTYYLSPAQGWASFGSLTIDVQTEMYMQKCEYYDPADKENSKFQKTETGYSATFTSLPQGELTLSVCTAETPVRSEDVFNGNGVTALIIIFSILIGAPLIAGLVILIIFLVRRGKRKKLQAAPAENLTPEQGEQTGIDPASIPAEGVAEDEVGELTSAPYEESKTYCTSCGRQISPTAAFCPYCGGAATPNAVPPAGNPNAGIPNAPSCNCQPPATDGGSRKRVNGLGIAGFVVSLVSLLFFDLEAIALMIILSLVGFGLSLTGVLLRKKYSRVYGLAIAGLVISSVLLFILIIICPIMLISLFTGGVVI